MITTKIVASNPFWFIFGLLLRLPFERWPLFQTSKPTVSNFFNESLLTGILIFNLPIKSLLTFWLSISKFLIQESLVLDRFFTHPIKLVHDLVTMTYTYRSIIMVGLLLWSSYQATHRSLLKKYNQCNWTVSDGHCAWVPVDSDWTRDCGRSNKL